MKNKIRIKAPTLFLMLMLMLLYPYIINMFISVPRDTIIVPLLLGISAIWAIIGRKSQSPFPNAVLVCVFLQAIAWFIFLIYHNDSSYFTRLVFLITCFSCLFMLVRTNSLGNFLNTYGEWMRIQAVLAAIAFVLVFIGLLKPLIKLADGDRVLYFYGITCTNASYGNFIRSAGFFDEPGALASWGIFSMILNKLTFDNRKMEIICAICLLTTWSAAFFVLIALYMICFHVSEFKHICFIVIATMVVLFVLQNTISDNDVFRSLTVERFEGGHIKSKRDIAAEVAKTEWKKNIWMGAGGRNLEKLTETAADNPYEILAKDGVIGFIITYLPLIIVLFKYRKKEIAASVLILMASYMQRPFHINEMHYLMIYLFMIVVCYKYDTRYKNAITNIQ